MKTAFEPSSNPPGKSDGCDTSLNVLHDAKTLPSPWMQDDGDDRFGMGSEMDGVPIDRVGCMRLNPFQTQKM